MAEYTHQEFELIKSSFVFKGASESVLKAALSREDCHRRSYRRGDCVFSPREFIRALGIIVSGSIQVTKNSGHRLAISRLRTGELFGAAAIFNDEEVFASILTALEPCSVIFFPEELIRQMMAMDFTIAENYIRYQSGRIRFLSSKIDGLSAGSAENRLAKYLLESTPDSGAVAATMIELADMLNIGRASLYRALDSLISSGAVAKEGKRLVVTDRSQLEKMIIQENK